MQTVCCVRNAKPLSPRRGEGPFGARIRWCLHAPANLLRCLRHIPRFPEGTGRLHQCLRLLGRGPRAVSGGNRAQLLTGTGF